MLFLFLFMGVLIFSSLVYVFENDENGSSFVTMLDAYWWALITMTTVGRVEHKVVRDQVRGSDVADTNSLMP